MFGLFASLRRIEQSLLAAKLERKKIMTAIDDLKAVVEKYIADVTAAVAAFKTDTQAKIDAAVAAALAGDNTAIQALSAEVAAADVVLPTPPIAGTPPAPADANVIPITG